MPRLIDAEELIEVAHRERLVMPPADGSTIKMDEVEDDT